MFENELFFIQADAQNLNPILARCCIQFSHRMESVGGFTLVRDAPLGIARDP